MGVLSIIGVTFIHSAQASSGGGLWKSQIMWIVIGFSLYTVISLIDYKIFLKLAHWIYGLAIILLLLVVIPGSPLAVTIYGATRWLNVGFTNIQPVEAGKLACIVITASILTRSEVGTIRESLQVLAKMALAILLPLILILAQPDLGSSLTIPPFVFAQLYASNLSKKFFASVILAFVAVVGVALMDNRSYVNFMEENELTPMEARGQYEDVAWFPFLHDYQRERILGFLSPDKVDSRGAGWNLEQSLISVASGGLTGKGIGQGDQAQLGYLPRKVAYNDFIFSVLAEESGFLGSVVVISLFGLLLGNSVRIASIARDRFGTLLVLGVATLFSVHIFVNIAMTIGMMPITGLPLPFLSHGGTFMISCCVLQGLVQSVYRHRKSF